MLQISENITYTEATRSDTAKRNGINNYFTPDQLVNMKLLAEHVYEPLVKHFGNKIYITSFFRSDKVNKLIGGVKGSQHLANNGAAMDLDSISPSNEDIFNYIKDNLTFDQLIIEDLKPEINGGIGWVHVSYQASDNKGEILIMILVNGKKYYEHYK